MVGFRVFANRALPYRQLALGFLEFVSYCIIEAECVESASYCATPSPDNSHPILTFGNLCCVAYYSIVHLLSQTIINHRVISDTKPLATARRPVILDSCEKTLCPAVC